MIEEKSVLSRQDFARMQTDVLSLRAVDGVPGLLSVLSGVADERVREAASHVESWDRRMEPDRVGATIFESFFDRWTEAVAAERFDQDAVSEMAGAIAGLALDLLSEDRHGWFETKGRLAGVQDAFRQALGDIEARLGEDMSGWTWGKLHTITLDHHLSGRGDLGQLLSRGGQPSGGNGITVCNTGHDPNYLAAMGANYRLVAELADPAPGLWAVDAAGQSGHPGSAHYCDQLPDWLAGRHHYLPLDKERARADARERLALVPQDS